jgi:hypothetical protein
MHIYSFFYEKPYFHILLARDKDGNLGLGTICAKKVRLVDLPNFLFSALLASAAAPIFHTPKTLKAGTLRSTYFLPQNL